MTIQVDNIELTKEISTTLKKSGLFDNPKFFYSILDKEDRILNINIFNSIDELLSGNMSDKGLIYIFKTFDGVNNIKIGVIVDDSEVSCGFIFKDGKQVVEDLIIDIVKDKAYYPIFYPEVKLLEIDIWNDELNDNNNIIKFNSSNSLKNYILTNYLN